MDIDRPTFAALRGGVDAQHDATTLPDAAAPRSSNAHRGATQLQCAPSSSLMLLQSGAVRECTDAWDLESHSAQGGINSAPFPDRAVRGAAVHPLLSSAPHARDDTGVTLLAQSWEKCRAAGGASGGEGDASWQQRRVWQISNDEDDGAGGVQQTSAGLASKKRKSAAGVFGGLGGTVIEAGSARGEDAPAAPLGWYNLSAAAGTTIGAGGLLHLSAPARAAGASAPPLRFRSESVEPRSARKRKIAAGAPAPAPRREALPCWSILPTANGPGVLKSPGRWAASSLRSSETDEDPASHATASVGLNNAIRHRELREQSRTTKAAVAAALVRFQLDDAIAELSGAHPGLVMDAVSPFLVRHISPQWATAYGYVAGETAALLGMPLTTLPTLGDEARGFLSTSMLFISSIAHIPHRFEFVLKTARKDGAELSDSCVCFHHGGGDCIILESLRAPLRCGGAANPAALPSSPSAAMLKQWCSSTAPTMVARRAAVAPPPADAPPPPADAPPLPKEQTDRRKVQRVHAQARYRQRNKERIERCHRTLKQGLTSATRFAETLVPSEKTLSFQDSAADLVKRYAPICGKHSLPPRVVRAAKLRISRRESASSLPSSAPPPSSSSSSTRTADVVAKDRQCRVRNMLEQLEREFNQLFREMQLHVRTSPELAIAVSGWISQPAPSTAASAVAAASSASASREVVTQLATTTNEAAATLAVGESTSTSAGDWITTATI